MFYFYFNFYKMVKGKIIRGKKLLTTTEPFITKRTLIIISVLIVLGGVIGVIVYFTVFKKSSSGSGGGGNTPTVGPGPPGPKPTGPPGPTHPPLPTGTFTVTGWDGWATTTKYGAETNWPGAGAIPSINMQNIANKGNGSQIGSITIPKTGETINVIGTMGGAVPWAVFNSLFGWKSRSEYLTTVINSCNGTNPVPCCLIIQPIGKFPDEIAPTNSPFNMVNGLCTSNCTDINDPNIVATYNNHANKFPAYFVVPYEGCGGNCSDTDPLNADCFNECSDIQHIVANFNYYNCKDSNGNSPTPPPGVCQTIQWMSNNNFNMTPEIEQKFYDANYDVFSISSQTNNGRNIDAKKTNFVNYCSGKNMHIDVMVLNNTGGAPYWCDLNNSQGDNDNSISLPSNGGANRGGDLTNTMVRYMLVPGNIFGNFNILDSASSMPPFPLPTNVCPGSGGGGGSGKCGKNWDDPNICKQPSCADNTNCTTDFPNCYNIPC